MSVHPMPPFEADGRPDDWDQAPCALAVVSDTFAVLRANALFLRLIGKAESDVVGARISEVFTKAGQLYIESVLIPLLYIEGSCQEVALAVAKDKSSIPVLVNVSLRIVRSARIYDVVIFPASGRRSFEEQVLSLKQESERRALWLAQLEMLSGVGAWTYELRTRRMLWSPRMYELYGAPPHAEVSLEMMLSRLSPDAREAVETVIEEPQACLELIERESDFQDPSGQARRLRIAGRYGVSSMGEPLLQGVMQDITEAHNRHADLWNAAHIDQMTGLGNRYLFNIELARRTGPGKRPGFDLLVLDLDGFKAVNDTYGHQAGDAVLAEIGRRIGRLKNAMGFRLGGDEFALIVKAAEQDFAGRLLSEIRRPINIGEQEVFVSASLGTSTYPVDGDRQNTLLHAADLAMYAAKKTSKELDARF